MTHAQQRFPSICLFVEGTFLPSREGATRRFLGVAKNLTALGHRVVVIHCHRGWSNLSLINSEKFTTYAVAPDVYYGDLNKIAEILQSEQIDIIQFAEIETIYRSGLHLKQLLPRVLLCYESHDVHSMFLQSVQTPASEVNLTILIERAVLAQCDLILCFTSEDMLALQSLGADRCRTFLVPFGIDIENICVYGPCVTARNILFLGNLYHWPNQEALGHIASVILPIVRRKQLGCTFLIVGDTPNAMRQYARFSELKFLGMVDKLDDAFCRTTMAIAPITSGSGIKVKLLDYFAAGLPTIGTEIAFRGLPKAGVVAPDLPSIAEHIERLLTSRQELISMGQAARRAAELVDWRRIRVGLSDVYQEVMSMPPRNADRMASLSDLPVVKAYPYFLEENIAGGRFQPSPYRPLPKGAVLRLGNNAPHHIF